MPAIAVRHSKDRRPGGASWRVMTPCRCCSSGLACLEHRGENFAQAPDPRLRPVGRDRARPENTAAPPGRAPEARHASACCIHSCIGSQHAAGSGSVRGRRVNSRPISSLSRNASSVPLLGLQHRLLHRLDDRQIAVDDEVQNSVKHVIDAVLEQPGR